MIPIQFLLKHGHTQDLVELEVLIGHPRGDSPTGWRWPVIALVVLLPLAALVPILKNNFATDWQCPCHGGCGWHMFSGETSL